MFKGSSLLSKMTVATVIVGIALTVYFLMLYESTPHIYAHALQIAYSPSGQFIAAATNDGVQIWDAALLKHIRTLGTRFGNDIFSGGPSLVAWSPDSQFIATNGPNDALDIWSASDAQLLFRLKVNGSQDDIRAIAFSPDGKLVASVGFGGTVLIWNSRTGKLARTINVEGARFASVIFSVDNKWLIGGATGMYVWNVENGVDTSERWEDSKYGNIRSLAVSQDGYTLVSGDEDGIVRVFDIEKHILLYKLEAQPDTIIQSIAISQDGRYFATGFALQEGQSADARFVRLWDVSSRTLIREFKQPRMTRALAFSPDGYTLAVASWDGNTRFWKIDE